MIFCLSDFRLEKASRKPQKRAMTYPVHFVFSKNLFSLQVYFLLFRIHLKQTIFEVMK